MSHPGKPISELGFDKVSDRFRKSVTCDGDDINKPDFRELDLGTGSGSPISPLRVGPTISNSSSSSGSVSGRIGCSSGGTTNHHSGELSVDSSPTLSVTGSLRVKSGHTRSESGSSVFSGGSSVSSPAVNVLPVGNICPSGRVLKTGMMANRSSKPDVLSLGTGNYGHGSIMRAAAVKSTGAGGIVGTETLVPAGSNSKLLLTDPEDLKRLGNEEYKKGRFLDALSLYDRAILLSPANAAYHCNRAAALMGLRRLTEAVKECDEAIKLDCGYVRAHHRLGSLLISLGQVENARRHLYFKDLKPDLNEAQKLQLVEKHLNKCTDSRRVGDWGNVLKETDAAISSGADTCAQLFACKAEALLKLHQLEDADSVLSDIPKFDACSPSGSQVKFFGMQYEAYVLFVRAQIDLSLGRFDNALTSIEKSGNLDPRNVEVVFLLQKIRSLCRSRARGNELFKSERFTEACSAYGDGLKYDPSNPILYCNRAACWFKLGQFERSLDDCNQALLVHPNYTKALLRRAATCSKLERWAESVRDYEVLRRVLPNDNDIAESLFHAQVALKKSRGEEVYNLKFGGEVELINNLKQFKAAILSTGASVVLFKTTSDLQCKQLSPFLDTLCTRYPSINFLKVDIEESPTIANVENVRIVPTIKIYKKGNRMKEMVCSSREVLESSVRHYSF